MLSLGERIGPFELVELEAEKNGVQTWRARRVDGKIRGKGEVTVRASSVPHGDSVQAVREEYEALRTLEDPRFPRLVGYYAGQAAFVVERPEGVTLDRVLELAREGRVMLDSATALDIAIELAQALRALHTRTSGPNVHGGLRPELIMLRNSGELCVLGLGQSRVQPDLRYAPPERVAGQPVAWSADQWLVGALLYEMLTLQPLYPEAPPEGVLIHRGKPHHQLAELAHRMPEAAHVLRKALGPAPDLRYATDAELLRSLHALARGYGEASTRRELPGKVAALSANISIDREVVHPRAAMTLQPRDEEVPLGRGPALSIQREPAMTRALSIEINPIDAPSIGHIGMLEVEDHTTEDSIAVMIDEREPTSQLVEGELVEPSSVEVPGAETTEPTVSVDVEFDDDTPYYVRRSLPEEHLAALAVGVFALTSVLALVSSFA